MPLHKDFDTGEVHQMHNYEYSTLASAQSATWSSGDVGKVFRITNEPSGHGYYVIGTSGGVFSKMELRQVDEVSTSDATETTIATISTSTDFVYRVDTVVIASVDGGGNAAGYNKNATFKNDSGTLTQIATTGGNDDEDDSTWDCGIDSSGTDIRVRVTGKAATDINWIAYTAVYSYANGA